MFVDEKGREIHADADSRAVRLPVLNMNTPCIYAFRLHVFVQTHKNFLIRTSSPFSSSDLLQTENM